jgi:hypothetical protein
VWEHFWTEPAEREPFTYRPGPGDGDTETEAERDKLREALEWIWGEMLEGGIDDLDTQNTLEELGLLVEVPADEQFKQDWDADTMYVLAWTVKGAGDE